MSKSRLLVMFVIIGLIGSIVGMATAQEVKLTYRLWNIDQVPAMNRIIEEFNKENPNIRVELEVIPFAQYWTTLETAATGRNLPDIFWMNAPNFMLYATNNMLLPLNDKIARDGFDITEYPESLVDLYSNDGKLYGMPKDFDTIGLWYNKEIFDEAGVAYPDDTWTWDDLVENAIALTDPSKNIWGFGAQLTDQLGFYNTVFQADGYVISEDGTKSGYDDPATIEGLRLWVDMINKHDASPTLAQMTDTPALGLFQSGRLAMMLAGSWHQVTFTKNEYTRGKVDAAVLPKGERRAVVIHGLSYAIGANTKHPEEAWKFVSFLGSRKAQEIQAETGIVIPAMNGTQDLWVQSNPALNLQAFIDQVEYSVPYPRSLYSSRWQQFQTEELTPAWTGEVSIEEAAKNLARRMNEILAQERR